MLINHFLPIIIKVNLCINYYPTSNILIINFYVKLRLLTIHSLQLDMYFIINFNRILFYILRSYFRRIHFLILNFNLK